MSSLTPIGRKTFVAPARLRARLQDPDVVLTVHVRLWELLGELRQHISDVSDGVFGVDLVREIILQILQPFLFQ